MRAKILIFFYKCYKCFGKRGGVTLKCLDVFLFFVQKIKCFVQILAVNIRSFVNGLPDVS